MEKYIIFKIEEWNKVPHAVKGDVMEVAEPIDDGVVIRRQDVFAPPAFEAYANSIQVALEINGSATDAATESLRSTADFFAEQAALSWDTERKLPD